MKRQSQRSVKQSRQIENSEEESQQIHQASSDEEDWSRRKPNKSKSQISREKKVNTRKRVQSENKGYEEQKQKEFESQVQEAKQKIQLQINDENENISEHQLFSHNSESIAYKKEIVKGQVAVDEYFIYKDKFHVYETSEKIFDCLLNQTNIVASNNNNKFYIAQILESDNSPYKYYFYTRWGRIGQKGQNAAKELNLESCIEEYETKIYDKNISGNYRIIQKFYPGIVANSKSDEQQFEECKLEKKIKELLRLIFDVKMMDRQMLEIGYDSSKMPLGKLGKQTITKGYKILEEISKAISDKKIKVNKRKQILELLSSEFYSQIPHNFGYSKPIVISEQKQIKDKLEMLASLEAIEIATKFLEQSKGNKYDAHYSQLQSNISYVESSSKTYEIIQEYLITTHAKTHSNYKLKILDIFEIEKPANNFKDCGNSMLLWHGSRLTNFVGILSQGLRIAPPEAPCTGYMFGKGIYFADSVSKSANYCCASHENSTALILLCNVSLGKWQERYRADYNANELQKGFNSTKGVGKAAPNKIIEFNNTQVPIGPMEELQIKSDLLYNEYIVYDVNQVQLKYLVKVSFIY